MSAESRGVAFSKEKLIETLNQSKNDETENIQAVEMFFDIAMTLPLKAFGVLLLNRVRLLEPEEVNCKDVSVLMTLCDQLRDLSRIVVAHHALQHIMGILDDNDKPRTQ